MKLNHIGIVVSDVIKEAQFYKAMGFAVSEVIINKAQKVKEVFVEQNSLTTIELLEPLNEQSPVSNFLKQGGGMHHLCYEIDEEINCFLSKQKGLGAVIIRQPIYDIAFDRKIAFFYNNGKIIEVVEALSQPS